MTKPDIWWPVIVQGPVRDARPPLFFSVEVTVTNRIILCPVTVQVPVLRPNRPLGVPVQIAVLRPTCTLGIPIQIPVTGTGCPLGIPVEVTVAGTCSPL